MAPWHVNITDEADADLKRLRQVRRKAWRVADGLLDTLSENPYIGDSCDPPLEGVRRVHFWNDRYRMAWLVVEAAERVDVLACDLKTPRFYDRVLERLLGLPDRISRPG